MDYSKSELLQWINTITKMQYAKVESLGNGIAYCKLLMLIDSNSINQSKIVLKPKTQIDNISNLKLLQSGFTKLHIKKTFNIDKVSKCSFHENMDILQFIRKLYDNRQVQQQENINPQEQINEINTFKQSKKEELNQSQNEIQLIEVCNILKRIDLNNEQKVNQLLNLLNIELPIQEQERNDQTNQNNNIFRTDSKRQYQLDQIQQKNTILCETPEDSFHSQNLDFESAIQQNCEFQSQLKQLSTKNKQLSEVEQLYEESSSSKKILDIQQLRIQEEQNNKIETPQFSEQKPNDYCGNNFERILQSSKQNQDIFQSAQQLQTPQDYFQSAISHQLNPQFSQQKQINYLQEEAQQQYQQSIHKEYYSQSVQKLNFYKNSQPKTLEQICSGFKSMNLNEQPNSMIVE